MNEQTLSLEECSRRLKSASVALQNLELKGRENMGTLLAALQMIDQVIFSIDNSMKEMEPHRPENKVDAVLMNEEK